MRGAVAVLLVAAMMWGAGVVEAREKSIEELPKDVWDLAFLWTEPFKRVAHHSRRLDPISGLWIGLLDGSVRSVQRSAKFFLFQDTDSEPSTPEAGRQIRYSF